MGSPAFSIPSLEALSSVIAESNSIINGSEKKVNLTIKQARPGSFTIDLTVIAIGAWNQIVDLLSGDSGDVIKILLATIGFHKDPSIVSLFELLKFLKGRKPDSVKEENDNVIITTAEGDKISVNKPVSNLYRSISVRKNIYKMTKTLDGENINSMQVVGESQETVFEFSHNDVEYYKAPDPDEYEIKELSPVEYRQVLHITSIAFKEENKWRLSDGQNTYVVDITDEDFINKVQNNEQEFYKDSMLDCKIRMIQTETPEGIKTRHEVIKVYDVRSPKRQILLPLEENVD